MVVDIFLVYQFLRRLATPFEEWKAFKLGIIDKNGNILKKRSTLRTEEERSAFRIFDNMILKLKRLIGKAPGGKSRLASYAAALYLVKEGVTDDVDEAQFRHYLNEVVNVAGGGNIGGLPPDDPPVDQKKKDKRKTVAAKLISRQGEK